jgi:hypothetical protein
MQQKRKHMDCNRNDVGTWICEVMPDTLIAFQMLVFLLPQVSSLSEENDFQVHRLRSLHRELTVHYRFAVNKNTSVCNSSL